MIFFGILSLLFLVGGLHYLKGPVSAIYLDYGVIGITGAYIALPGSVAFAILGLAASPLIPTNWQPPLIWVSLFCLVLGVIMSSKWFKPTWLKWLEQDHGDVIDLLRAEIQKEGVLDWDKRINTQEELETWVLEVRRKYGI